MKIIFFGSNDFVVPIFDQLRAAHEVVAIVTTPDAPAGRKQTLTPTPIAKHTVNSHIPLLKPERLNDPQFLESINALGAEIFIVASYGKIIPKAILDLPTHGVLNVHPSLLPKYRGPTPIQTSLANSDTETGVTIIKMDEKVDHGPIVAQAKYVIKPDQTFATLANELFLMGAKILLESLEGYINGSIIPRPQEDGEASFTKMLTKADGRIDWNQTAQKIYNQYRAYQLWPGVWTEWNGNVLKILDCLIVEVNSASNPGTVDKLGVVQCGNNTGLQINSLQLAGKQATDIQSFLRGYPTFINTKLT